MSTGDTAEVVMNLTTLVERRRTLITIGVNQLLTSRILGPKLISLTVPLNGTVEDLIAKCIRVSDLDDNLYILLSEIAKEPEKPEELME